MGLFTKKDPCAICGGKVKGLFPWKVEGQLVCKTCYGNVHLPKEFVENMTMAQFQEYRIFREQNNILRQQFQTTEQVDFGFFSEHFLFDTTHRLFCPSVNLDSTIFEGKCIKSFTIREDNELLFEGSANGLICYNSTVKDRVIAMAPMIRQAAMMIRLKEEAERMAEAAGKDSNRTYSGNYVQTIPEPFHKFFVEIHCDHPYWKTLTTDKKGPEFSESRPDVDDYMRLYNDDAALMEKLARSLMAVAFPDAPEQRVNRNGAEQTTAAPAAPVDAVAEIQRFKDLLDQGIITEEEFTAKKRQLLGI